MFQENIKGHMEEERKIRANERDKRLGWRSKQKREGISTSAKLTTSIHPTRSRELECVMYSGKWHMTSQRLGWKALTNELKEKEIKENELRENEMREKQVEGKRK